MNILRKALVAVGIITSLALLVTLVAPKAAHAVVSTLVTIANTSTNPVPTQAVDNPALEQTFTASGECLASNDRQCLLEGFFNIPVGMTAVVKDISGHCQLSDPNYPPVHIMVGAGNSDAAATAGFSVEMTPTFVGNYGDAVWDFGRETTLYAPSTTTFPSSFGLFAVTSGYCVVNISGYYVKNGQ